MPTGKEAFLVRSRGYRVPGRSPIALTLSSLVTMAARSGAWRGKTPARQSFHFSGIVIAPSLFYNGYVAGRAVLARQ